MGLRHWIVKWLKPDFTKWERLNLEDTGQPSLSQTNPGRRAEAEKETNKDLRKSIQQLICDVHEEVTDPNNTLQERLIHAIKRQTSMMGRVALVHERNSSLLIWLTVAIALLTIVIAALTIVILFKE